jgi:hypothetical protein
LAACVTVESVRSLLGGAEAAHSTVGIALAAISLAVMPGLSCAQRRAGRELGSRTAVADSKQMLLCTYLSAVLLAGLLLTSLFGWSWADPIAALIIAAVVVKEGLLRAHAGGSAVWTVAVVRGIGNPWVEEDRLHPRRRLSSAVPAITSPRPAPFAPGASMGEQVGAARWEPKTRPYSVAEMHKYGRGAGQSRWRDTSQTCSPRGPGAGRRREMTNA